MKKKIKKNIKFLLKYMTTSVFIFTASLVFLSCECEDIGPPIIPPPPVACFTVIDVMDYFSVSSTSTGEISEYLWQVSGEHQTLFKPKGNYAVIDLSLVTTTITVSLTVNNSGGSSTYTEMIDLPALSFHRKYGLGKNLESEWSNNVDYEWYIDQTTTGQYGSTNCGPSCATMAIKWANPDFTKTVEDARNAFPIIFPSTGWTKYFMTSYLTDNQTANKKMYFLDTDNLKKQIDNGSIVILSLDMHYIRYMDISKPEFRIDGFIPYNMKGWYHAIIVKGYKIVDGILWFEVYDPYSSGYRYNDGALKGRDRYYRSEDITSAAYQCKDITQAATIGDPYPEIIIVYRSDGVHPH